MLSDAVNCHDIDKTICASQETVSFFFLVSFVFFCYILEIIDVFLLSFKRHCFWQHLQPKAWSVIAIWCLHTWTGFHQYQSLLKLHKNIGKNLNQQNRVSAFRSILVNPLAPELFFLILAQPVYKMWIIQEPNKLALWNKLHFEEKTPRV